MDMLPGASAARTRWDRTVSEILRGSFGGGVDPHGWWWGWCASSGGACSSVGRSMIQRRIATVSLRDQSRRETGVPPQRFSEERDRQISALGRAEVVRAAGGQNRKWSEQQVGQAVDDERVVRTSRWL